MKKSEKEGEDEEEMMEERGKAQMCLTKYYSTLMQKTV